MFRAPADTYKAYERFLRKKNYRKAYQCLESLLREFPDDEMLIERIIDLCLDLEKKSNLAKHWLTKLIKIRTNWFDYTLLARLEAELGHFPKAREYLKQAKEFSRHLALKDKQKTKKLIAELDGFINYKEYQQTRQQYSQIQEKAAPSKQNRAKEKKTLRPAAKMISSSKPNNKKEIKPPLKEKQETKQIPAYQIPIIISPFKQNTSHPRQAAPAFSLKELQLFLNFTHLTIQGGFNELICLNTLRGIEKYWYQIETVKKVLKYFHGRVLLCDEVGLGKTIEAGMLIKEYLMRKMAKNVLILAPPPLVSQWKEEMLVKFDLEFTTTDDVLFARDTGKLWKEQLVIASIHTAKNKKNISLVTNQFFDIVVVDEAHHLRNRTTQTWKMVNSLKKKFIFLLTATPVQNNLIELYNLITLLKPGQFKTESSFKNEFLEKEEVRKPANKEKLRGLLKDVMIRNTRGAIDLKLPKRFAATLRLEPTEAEKKMYLWLNDYLRKASIKRHTANLLLKEAGSSPFALRKTLQNHLNDTKEMVEFIDNFTDTSKGNALIKIMRENPEEKKIIFTQYLNSLDYITGLLKTHHIAYTTFSGIMTTAEKNNAIEKFREKVPVLVSTESGGEGRNIQFCNTIINFDLPWNPMRIEQRIGRLHRIGQTRDVFIFNLSVKGTIEDYIIDILDNKINMFEMVIGEIEPIIGYIGKDNDFENIIMEIWLRSNNEKTLENNFTQFGNQIIEAKKEYLKAKDYDTAIFGEDYEI
ncbi:MAG: SNF2-related protein [Candidatus Omnitrophota bacterium]